MSSYYTSGREIYRDFMMPLVYSPGSDLVDRDSGYFQLLFIEEGTLVLAGEGAQRSVPAPFLLYLGPGHTLSSAGGSGLKAHSFIFRPEALNANLHDTPDGPDANGYFFLLPFYSLPERGYALKSFPAEFCRRFIALSAKVDENLNGQGGIFWPCLTRSYFLELLILFERTGYLSWEPQSFLMPATGTPLDRVFLYFHTHYQERLTVADIAALFATNRTTLNSQVQKYSGMSVMAYLNDLRLEVAASLLRNTTLPVAEISGRVGIDDLSYFSRSFRRKTGRSPSVYRQSFPDPYAAGS